MKALMLATNALPNLEEEESIKVGSNMTMSPNNVLEIV